MLPTIPDCAYDLVFSMAMLQHIHPAMLDVMRQMSRVASNLVLICEREDVHTLSIVPRNYQCIFERFGLRQSHAEKLDHFADPMYNYYIVRLCGKG